MSLNGLDDPSIIESYQSALAEAGGWFLLKYIARDAVALLARGTGGVAEIRITIDGYDEKSPLYGFLQYRRRKIILKYVPEGVSRLIQARISVQFQSVLDKFTPNDTVFHLSVPSELTESALSSACLLHAASGSMTSSTSSLRRRKLGEITEDAEESGGEKEVKKQPSSQDANRRESVYSRTSEATAVPTQRDGDSISLHKTPSKLADEAPETEKPLPSIPRNRTDSHANSIRSKQSTDQLSLAATEPRQSTQSTRPAARDLDQNGVRRPKVKLGPRPSMDPNGRPRTAGSLGKSRDSSLVSSLPAGLRSSARKSNPSHQKFYRENEPPDVPQARVPPVPSLQVPPPSLNLGPTSKTGGSSPRSIMSVPASLSMTPEKQRLMKALQKRKEQMSKRADEAEKKKKEEASEAEKEAPPEPSRSTPKEPETKAEEQLAPTTKEPPPKQNETPAEPSKQEDNHPENTTTKDERDLSPGPSTPDSAVGMADTDSSVGETPETSPHADYKVPKDRTNEPQHTRESSSTSTDLSLSDIQLDLESNGQHSSPPEAKALSSTKHEEDETFTTDAPYTNGSGQLRTTEIEARDLPSSETPTPRAIPFTMSHPEIKTETQEPLSSKDEIESTAPAEAKVEVQEPLSDKDEIEVVPSVEEPQPESVSPSDVSQPPSEPKNAEVSTLEIEDEAPAASVRNETDKGLKRKSTLKERRQGNVDPIQLPTPANYSDEENLLSDDSFMDELGSASVQEARPIALPRPGTNDGSGSPSGPWPNSRVVSSPVESMDSDFQALPPERSASGTFVEGPGQVPVMVARKVNVSSGISKRIKALEMFSGGDAPAPPPVPAQSVSRSSSQFDKYRKRTSLSQTNIPPAAELDYKPEAQADHSLPQEKFSPAHNRARTKSSSVSVTARIVRSSSTAQEPHNSPSDPSGINLQRSELFVEQDGQGQISYNSTPTANQPDPPRQSTSSGPHSTRNSANGQLLPSERPNSRLSISSLSRNDERTLSHSSSEQIAEEGEDGRDDKKESRKSRIMRRMSSITSSNSRRSKKSALSPPVQEEEPAPLVAPDGPSSDDLHGAVPQIVDIGEVNVQFPDTLLWKRRYLRVDDQGYLILTPAILDGTARVVVKKYHFSEFRTPCLPDQDRQELPNSILLDFLDGNTLQCACESRQGQTAVLQTLIDAHRTYHNARSG